MTKPNLNFYTNENTNELRLRADLAQPLHRAGRLVVLKNYIRERVLDGKKVLGNVNSMISARNRRECPVATGQWSKRSSRVSLTLARIQNRSTIPAACVPKPHAVVSLSDGINNDIPDAMRFQDRLLYGMKPIVTCWGQLIQKK